MTNATGVIQKESDYYPYGAERQVTNPVDLNYKFVGMEYDPETGAYHTLYRQYSPNLGRWFSRDPERGCVRNPQGLNLYAYVLDNPTNLTDPFGNQVPELSDLFTIPCLPYTAGCSWSPDDPWGTYGSSPAEGGNPDFWFSVYYRANMQSYLILSASGRPTRDPVACRMCRADCETRRVVYMTLCIAGAYFGFTGFDCLVAVQENYRNCQRDCNQKDCREEAGPRPPLSPFVRPVGRLSKQSPVSPFVRPIDRLLKQSGVE
ncbi:MAG: RHS repeat-associated core domain-containing protein [Acidobacteriia bacterium]|nr:RHS repeat-associated core domain-containing protein [Terriglobia bacterium]